MLNGLSTRRRCHNFGRISTLDFYVRFAQSFGPCRNGKRELGFGWFSFSIDGLRRLGGFRQSACPVPQVAAQCDAGTRRGLSALQKCDTASALRLWLWGVCQGPGKNSRACLPKAPGKGKAGGAGKARKTVQPCSTARIADMKLTENPIRVLSVYAPKHYD